MKKAEIIIGANYGDEGKGTVVAHLTKNRENVINILTNGGAQRGHSILTKDGSITFQHFGSGTYHGADNYYSRFFIMNPMQFVKEYNSLIIKPKNIFRNRICRWTTPYDSMANLIKEETLNRKASCGMGIWNTIKRCDSMPIMLFDDFLRMEKPEIWLQRIKEYYEDSLPTLNPKWKKIWDSPAIMTNFIEDCKFLAEHTKVAKITDLNYDNLIFENGQGLLLCDTGKDTYDTTPSNTGILYSLCILRELKDVDVTAHYVTRPYLTRHGDGEINGTYHIEDKHFISKDIQDDRTNHYNEFQGEFRYGFLGIEDLKKRILSDAKDTKFVLEVTHCDEMDRLSEFKKIFETVNTYDSPLV